MRKKLYESSETLYASSWLDAQTLAEVEEKRRQVHAEKYEKHKEAAAARQRDQSEEGREIGPLPKCEHRDLVEICRYDLLQFMLTFGNSNPDDRKFSDPFCEAQLYAIQVVQETLLSGGNRPLCLPRGFAKTTICEWGIAWAIAYGHQQFVLVIAAKLNLAEQILQNIQKIITENELLAACFPALCYPIACLEKNPQRAPGQTLSGVHTNIKINSRQFIAPTVSGAASSGAIITASGLEGAIRGLKIGSKRPTAVIIDDPQTEKSAASVTQTEKRWNLLSGCVQGLAGPKTNLAMIATVTVQNPDDLSERILKEWGGRRFSMLRSLPKNMELWQEYDKLRKLGIINYLETADQIREANEFYQTHRSEMDEGAEAEWETHFTPTEFSATQHAMNLYFKNRKTFYAEYQNAPLALLDETQNLQYEELVKKIIPIPRGEVPIDCERITAGIDIQKECLYWTIIAWGDGFRGHVLDYGRFPSGGMTIQERFPQASEKDAFYLALMELCPILSQRRFSRQDGTQLPITKGLIDANRGLFTPQVRKACFDLKEIWEPVFGWGKGADELFIRNKLRSGEERGDNWQRPPLIAANLVRHTRYDTNYWKSNVRVLWQTPAGSSGSLTLFDGDEVTHWTFLQHQLSERSTPSTGPRGTIDKWVQIPGQENHLWDCVVMATVANSTLGGRFHSGTPIATEPVVHYTGNWSEIAQ